MEKPGLVFCGISIRNLMCIALVLLATRSHAQVDSRLQIPEELPTPPELMHDVLFWERVFGDYSPDQCVFHDEWNLNVVYYVSPVARHARNKASILQRHMRGIRNALQKFAKGQSPKGQYELRIMRAIPPQLQTKEFFAEAKDQVRCQRGVDFEPSLQRSRKLMPMIKTVLKNKGMPQDIAYLPHLESGFNIMAMSRAGARGLWQFMKHTARIEGLTIARRIDHRVDPNASTDAATDYLMSIFLKVQSWPLAITAFNYGQNGVIRAVKKFGPDYVKIRTEHKTKIFGFAARNYYPSFLAARNVAKRREATWANIPQPTQVIATSK
jgi:membrane-bound lytic murein transglycosylase D